jgi:hypothetical protein
MVKTRIKTVILAGGLALAGCAYPNPQHVAQVSALVGKSETDLVHALGVPSRTYETGGHKFLAYSRSKIESTPGDFGPWGWGGGYWGRGWGGWGGGFPPEIVQRDCETTFDLLNGVVQSWNFRGNDC